MQELEQRIRSYECQGVNASVELQSAARKVSEENKCLRKLMKQNGISDTKVEQYLKDEIPSTDDQHSSTAPVGAGSPRSAVETAELLMRARPVVRKTSHEADALDEGAQNLKQEGDSTVNTTSLSHARAILSPPVDPKLSSPWDKHTPDRAASPRSTQYSDELGDSHFHRWDHHPPPLPPYASSSAYLHHGSEYGHHGQQFSHGHGVNPPTTPHTHYPAYTGPPHGYGYEQSMASSASYDTSRTYTRNSHRQNPALDWPSAGGYATIHSTSGEYHPTYPDVPF